MVNTLARYFLVSLYGDVDPPIVFKLNQISVEGSLILVASNVEMQPMDDCES